MSLLRKKTLVLRPGVVGHVPPCVTRSNWLEAIPSHCFALPCFTIFVCIQGVYSHQQLVGEEQDGGLLGVNSICLPNRKERRCCPQTVITSSVSRDSFQVVGGCFLLSYPPLSFTPIPFLFHAPLPLTMGELHRPLRLKHRVPRLRLILTSLQMAQK